MARVIRGDGAKVIPAQVVDAHAEADQILADARARAEAIEAEARDTIEASVRATLEAELAAAWLEVEAARQAALEGAHESVAELALAVAGHLVHDAIEAEPERVRALVDDALSRVRRARAVKVRVHPEDAPALGSDAAHAGEGFPHSGGAFPSGPQHANPAGSITLDERLAAPSRLPRGHPGLVPGARRARA